MARYFKITEIDSDTFIDATGDTLDCFQLTITCDGYVYVAIDDCESDELTISLDIFDD